MTLLGLSYFYCYQQLKEIVGDILKKNLVTALCNFEKLQEQFLAIEFFRRLSVISRTAFRRNLIPSHQDREPVYKI